MKKRYIPNAGDIIWLHFDLSAARPATSHKAAVVLSPSAYNKKTGLMVCCPVTSELKGYPFEVLLDTEPDSAVLSDQVKSLDWINSKITCQGRISSAELAEVRAKLHALVFKG